MSSVRQFLMRSNAVVCALAMLAAPSTGYAAELTLGLSFEAGLDQPTKDLFEKEPDLIKQKMIEAVTEAMPVIDKSVNSYIETARRALNDVVTHANCDIAARIKDGHDILSGFYQKPVEYLQSEIQKAKDKALNSDLSHEKVRIYLDTIYQIHFTECYIDEFARGEKRLFDKEMIETQVDILPRAILWSNLSTICDTPDSCYSRRLKEVTDFARQSDPRDVALFKAADRIKALPTPDSLQRSGFSWTPEVNFIYSVDYESPLLEIARIQSGIIVARVSREAQADDEVDAALHLVQSADTAAHAAQDLMQTGLQNENIAQGRAQVQDGLNREAAIAGANAEIELHLQNAVAEDEGRASNADGVRNYWNSIVKFSHQVHDDGPKDFAELNQRSAQQEADRRAEFEGEVETGHMHR